jgi:alkylation response protein AidB-like acyl-CoA dehydrogenase
MEEAGAAGSIRTTANILSLIAELLSAAGSSEQKRRFLRPLLAGQRWGGSPSPSRRPARTRHRWPLLAERLPTRSYRLTGRKAYITNASYAGLRDRARHHRSRPRRPRHHGVSSSSTGQADTVSWPAATAGPRGQLLRRPIRRCVVPAGNVLGDEGRGLSLAIGPSTADGST